MDRRTGRSPIRAHARLDGRCRRRDTVETPRVEIERGPRSRELRSMRIFLRILLVLGVLVVLGVSYGLFQIWRHGAWGIFFPSDAYETEAPEITADFGQGATLRVLLYTKTNSFRHKEGIAAVQALFERFAQERGWAVFPTENSAVFDPALLDRFDVVVFANASGNHASDEQDRAFQGWLEAAVGSAFMPPATTRTPRGPGMKRRSRAGPTSGISSDRRPRRRAWSSRRETIP
jgi:hypothetical protein